MTFQTITIDEAEGVVIVKDEDGEHRYPMASAEAFRAVSRAWIRCGWDTKYVYSFTWLGRPIIQLPEDMLRLQEVIYRVKPDVIVETGIAHGGSLIFSASLCKAMDKGRVIGIDIEIRPHNRAAIEAHELFPYITMIEGSSVDPTVVEQVKSLIEPGERILVALDSNHTKDHVLAELEAYAPLIPVGSYILAADGVMEQTAGAPRTEGDWSWNNPKAAAEAFVANHPGYVIEEPELPFNEGMVTDRVTYWPSGFITRIK